MNMMNADKFREVTVLCVGLVPKFQLENRHTQLSSSEGNLMNGPGIAAPSSGVLSYNK